MEKNLIAIAVLIGLGVWSGKIAEKKGRSFWKYFIFGFFFQPITLIIAAMIRPDTKTKEESMLKSGQFKKCTGCAELVRSDAQVCRFCGRTDFVKSF